MSHPMSMRAFKALQQMFLSASGILLMDGKRKLVEARLRSRLELLSLPDFDAYCATLKHDLGERQLAVELLTTNETYFFREPDHFTQLKEQLATRFAGRPVSIWSAACASGEEPYSIAMTLMDTRPDRKWELHASDLAQRMLERARLGIYAISRLDALPDGYLKRFAKRGTGEYEGKLRVSEELRSSVRFFQHNLLHDDPGVGSHDVIFLRNVLIYFDFDRKRAILDAVLRRLRPGGLLFIGHSESLQGLSLPLERVHRAVFAREVSQESS